MPFFVAIRKGVNAMAGGVDRVISVYNQKKVKLGLQVTEHHRDKLNGLARMWGVTANTLICLMIDELYYEPLSPTLPRAMDDATNRVTQFFRKTGRYGKSESRV